LELKKWKARVKQVEAYLSKPVILARKVLYWRGRLKKEWEVVLEQGGEREEMLGLVEAKETEKRG